MLSKQLFLLISFIVTIITCNISAMDESKHKDIPSISQQGQGSGVILEQIHREVYMGETLLHRAVRKNDDDEVFRLIHEGVDIDAPEDVGYCSFRTDSDEYLGARPLQLAAGRGQANIVMMLLGHGAELEAKDARGFTALHWAAQNGHVDLVQILLDQGAQLEEPCTPKYPMHWEEDYYSTDVAEVLLGVASDELELNKGLTPLHVAAYNGHEKVVALLLERGAQVDPLNNYSATPLHGAVWGGHEAVVKLLLDRGAQINALVGSGNYTNFTVLHVAAMNGQEAMVQVLLGNGINIETATPSGVTALHEAAKNGHVPLVTLLLDRGASLEPRFGPGALYWAARRGHGAVVRLLLDKGAQIDAWFQGKTPLHGAALRGSADVVRLLLNRGAQVEVESSFWSTPLYDAAEAGCLDAVKELLKGGAHLDTTHGGLTALHVAAKNGRTDVVRFLLDQGAQFEASHLKSTPLSDAAEKGHRGVVELLLERGALIVTPHTNALLQAAEKKQDAVVELLIEKGGGSGITCLQDIEELLPRCRYRSVRNSLLSYIVAIPSPAIARALVDERYDQCLQMFKRVTEQGITFDEQEVKKAMLAVLKKKVQAPLSQ